MLLLRLIRLQRHRHRHFCRHPFRIHNALFSSLASPEPQTSTTLNPMVKPSSLSERMSFVFEKIDAIEKERSQKDETLQRIRAWRESKKQPSTATDSPSADSDQNVATKEDENAGVNTSILSSKKELELSHPWPEWVELMERLVKQNYFDHRRKDEDKMLENSGFSISEMVEEDGFDFTRDLKTVLNAVLNFGNDRFDILRSLSRQDLQILVGYGCPSVDKRVVFSCKLLRKHTNLDEGDVCSSCSLRTSCEKAYLLTNKEDDVRTIDVMRVLMTYAFGAIDGAVVNESLLKKKSLKNSIRKLLHEVVKLSAVPIDPNLPPPIKRKPPPKVKQPPPPPRKRVGRDDIEMKKGDWLCTKCDFMNFAKNTVCLQCDAKRPKRQLLPGEWECPQCNFLNYRRNVVCFHCEHKRPQDDFMENQMQERPPYQQRSPRSIEKTPSRRADVSDAWNFDFDENESDGADVAAFEYADSHKLNQDFPLEKGFQEEDKYKPGSARLGFNDFDDEDDDDIGNYELDNQNDGKTVPRINLSELEVDDDSLSENDEQPRNNRRDHRPSNSRAQRKHGPDDFNSDDDLPNHPNWKSSHVMQFDQKSKRRGGDMSFGSDDDELDSDDDFGTQKKMNQKRNSRLKYSSETDDDDDIEDDSRSSRRGKGIKSSPRKPKKTVDFDSDDEPFSDVESDYNNSRFHRGRGGGQSGRGRNASFADIESDDDNRFNRGRGGVGGGGQRGRGRNSSFSDVESDDDNRFNRGRGGGGQRGRGRKSSFSDVESDDDNRFNRGRGGGRGGGQRGRGRNSSFSDVESDDDNRFNRGRGGGGRGGGQRGRGRNSSFSDMESDDDNRFNRGRGGGGQRGRGRNSSFSSRKDSFSRGGGRSSPSSRGSYNERDGGGGDFKNGRNRGRGGGRSSYDDRKSFGRSDYKDNNNNNNNNYNNKGGSYLDDERYGRPRNNVR